MKTPEEKKHFEQLVENAFDFLFRSLDDFDSNPKHSVINFQAAVELFLKARLMADHWSLLVRRGQEPDWQQFLSGKFQSVSLAEAAERLQKVVRNGLSPEARKVFDEITTHRNRMVHFFHEAQSAEEGQRRFQGIAREQLRAWHFLHRLLLDQWKCYFSRWTDKVQEVEARLRKRREFLEVVFQNLKSELTGRSEAGAQIVECSSCGFQAMECHGSADAQPYESKCHVCNLAESCVTVTCASCDQLLHFINEGVLECGSCHKKYEPSDLAELLQEMVDGHATSGDYTDPKWDLGNCSSCDGYHTVVRVTPEENQDIYLCTSCFQQFPRVESCEWCNEPNTGDMEYSSLAGCNHCPGRAGQDDD